MKMDVSEQTLNQPKPEELSSGHINSNSFEEMNMNEKPLNQLTLKEPSLDNTDLV